jgi:hypothetical protein
VARDLHARHVIRVEAMWRARTIVELVAQEPGSADAVGDNMTKILKPTIDL